MTPPIERLRYYDGEYLRAFDFADEQTYHLEMRRRLNMALHLSGIVEGLGITPDPDPPVAGITQYSIDIGMAIDPYGREILVLAPYVLDEAVLAANRITSTGYYELWLRYHRQATTPPSAGFANCDSANEYMRWREGFDVFLLPRVGTTAAPADPLPTDPQSDDPTADLLGVKLGVVHVNSSAGAVSIDDFKGENRTYIGLRAQRVVCPVEPAAFKILEVQDALDPATSLDLQCNVFADENLIVGKDFSVMLPSGAPAPAATGNVKVANTLFLQGELYSLRQSGNPATNVWLSLGDYIKSFQPDVQASKQPLVVPIPGSGATSDAVSSGSVAPPILLTSSLVQVDATKALVFASISGVQYQAAFTGNLNTVGMSVKATIMPTGSQPNTFNLMLTWSLSGAILSGVNWIPPISTLSISWVVVFYPK